MENSRKLLDPQTLAKIKALEIKARQIIEGLVAGSHKSPFQGMSIEFAEHREYAPGDDIRHLDWKVFGKTDKYYLKEYEQETNLVCNLVFDASQSMSYASGETSKLNYAAQMAASLAYLVLQQQDSIGLTLFDDQVRELIQPSGQPMQLKQILQLLAECAPTENQSQIGSVLHEIADRYRKRSLVIVISDCFDDVENIIKGLNHLRYKRHEVVLFQVLDPAEVDFPFQNITMFKGLERLPQVLVEPRGLRKAYRQVFREYQKALMVGCRSAHVDYQLVRTDQPLDVVMTRYLATRLAKSA